MLLIKYVDIDPLFLTVARISTYDDVETGRVWGLFYSNPKGDLFLITNRHVIKDEQNSYIPNIVRLSLHANPDNLRENHDYDISLYVVFPSVLRSLLDTKARGLDEKILVTASYAIASLVEKTHLKEDYVIPQVNDPRILPIVRTLEEAIG
jgi:hypothetical protein